LPRLRRVAATARRSSARTGSQSRSYLAAAACAAHPPGPWPQRCHRRRRRPRVQGHVRQAEALARQDRAARHHLQEPARAEASAHVRIAAATPPPISAPRRTERGSRGRGGRRRRRELVKRVEEDAPRVVEEGGGGEGPRPDQRPEHVPAPALAAAPAASAPTAAPRLRLLVVGTPLDHERVAAPARERERRRPGEVQVRGGGAALARRGEEGTGGTARTRRGEVGAGHARATLQSQVGRTQGSHLRQPRGQRLGAAPGLGFGRIVVSEIKALIMLAIMV
jgi:hypothetical protein